MTVAEPATAGNILQAVDCKNQKVARIGTLEVDVHSSDPSAELCSNISAVLYMPEKDKESQMLCHTTVPNCDTSRLAQDWRNEIHFFKMYSEYRAEFINMPTNFLIIVKRPPRSHERSKTPYRIHLRQYKTCSLGSIPWWTKEKRGRKSWEWKYAVLKDPWTGIDGMGCNNYLRSEET